MAIIVLLSTKGNDGLQKKIEMANQYLLELDYENAIALYDEVLEIDSKNVEAYLGLAECYINQDKLDDARIIIEKGLEETSSEELKEMLEEFYKEDIENEKESTDKEDNSDENDEGTVEASKEIPLYTMDDYVGTWVLIRSSVDYFGNSKSGYYYVFNADGTGEYSYCDEKAYKAAGPSEGKGGTYFSKGSDLRVSDFYKKISFTYNEENGIVAIVFEDGKEVSYEVNNKILYENMIPFVKIEGDSEGMTGIWSTSSNNGYDKNNIINDILIIKDNGTADWIYVENLEVPEEYEYAYPTACELLEDGSLLVYEGPDWDNWPVKITDLNWILHGGYSDTAIFFKLK